MRNMDNLLQTVNASLSTEDINNNSEIAVEAENSTPSLYMLPLPTAETVVNESFLTLGEKIPYLKRTSFFSFPFLMSPSFKVMNAIDCLI